MGLASRMVSEKMAVLAVVRQSYIAREEEEIYLKKPDGSSVRISKEIQQPDIRQRCKSQTMATTLDDAATGAGNKDAKLSWM